MHKRATLSPEALAILCDKKTEPPVFNEENAISQPGTYVCRGCGLGLYRSASKFSSGCGWPAFDHEIQDTVARYPDADGRRTEIRCARCNGHLGHVFTGEGYTQKNVRHCVNIRALDFVRSTTLLDSAEAIVAGGCFWGMQFFLEQLPGVVKTEVGYIGGNTEYPSYATVCLGNTGHREATRVIYDTALLDYTRLMQYFFEIHDPTQTDGQGPDKGESYQSALFYGNDDQKASAEQCIAALRQKNYAIATELYPATTFWRAEEAHQDYYAKTGKLPYCHRWVQRW